ncbi:hypothetical protein GURASL_10960 [Geotalea uraniireducens]|uniref:Histidine kinase/HSP90-like ATPase domain-containing protein n=1 Tax=Geotalea uraniireducens TaxID=351604 RepID=A0ABM8EIE0_9BACT|nr:ATP-binding protein [Geotalea uraniireducens]BDV42173.1 hypothetical protein GURASL_10960 [Geotalea uraniireducens]
METLIVPDTLDSLAKIGDYVKRAAAAAGLDSKAAYNLRLAVDEFATNIILHGYQEAGLSGEVVIRGEMADNALTIIIEDTGAAFDPRSLKLPEAEELARPIEEREPGGLGIFLALNGVDDFNYERDGDRNRNIFVMRRKGAGAEG